MANDYFSDLSNDNDLELDNSLTTLFISENVDQMVVNFLQEVLTNKENDNGPSVASLRLAYEIPDNSFFHIFLEQWHVKLPLLSNDEGLSLLMSFIEDKEFGILLKTLNKCDIDGENQQLLVQLSLFALQQNHTALFDNIIKNYSLHNSILYNNETFLTNAIKRDFSEIMVNKIIDSKLFDINQPNGSNDTPLIMACDKLMTGVVKKLLEYNCDIYYNKSRALDVTMAKDNSVNRDIAIVITKLLFEARVNSTTYEYVANSVPIVTISTDDNTKSFIYSSDIKMIIQDIIVLMVAHRGHISVFNSAGDSLISLAYKLPNKQVLQMFIDNSEADLSLLKETEGLRLLKTMLNNNEFDLFVILLNKCQIIEDNDDSLLDMALIAIKQMSCDVCRIILEKCVNRHKLLVNDETFVTNLFKENVDKSSLIGLFDMKLFDLNLPNRSNVTPLIMASERLWPDVVALLISNGCEVSWQNYRAVEVAILNAVNGSPECLSAKNEILKLFFENCLSVTVPNAQSDRRVLETDVQYAVLTNYPLTSTVPKRSSRTSLLEIFIFALFAKSDFMDYVFRSNSCDDTEINNFLSTKIVYPLRKNGFISQTVIFEFIGIIRRQQIFPLSTEKDIDIDDVSTLFSSLSTMDNLLSFITGSGSRHDAFYISLLAKTSESLLNISTQDLLNLHMVQQNKLFAKIPGCLILEIPRHKKGYGNFNNILPSNVIDISHLFLHYDKRCSLCDKKAKSWCGQCLESHKFTINCVVYGCQQKCAHGDRADMPISSNPRIQSISRQKMDLQAIICNDKDSFVAFIKQNNDEWLSFNSLDGSRIPIVTCDSDVSLFLSYPDKTQKAVIFRQVRRYLRQILNDSYVFVYTNSTVSCY